MDAIFQDKDLNFFDVPKPKITPFELRPLYPKNEQLINSFREYPMSFIESMFYKIPEFNGSLWGYYMAVLGKYPSVHIIVDDRVMTKLITKKNGETYYIEYNQVGYIEQYDVPTTDNFVNNIKQVVEGRRLKKLKDKKGYEKQKSSSFSVSGSAIYRLDTPNRWAENIAFRNHLLFIDIDLDENYDLVAVFKILKADKYTKMVHLSFSGDGFVVVVEMTEKDAYNNFKLVFKKLEKYYKEIYNLTIDPSCSDVGRLRYLSYDLNIFIKQNTLVEITQEEIDADTKQRKRELKRTVAKIAGFERKQKDNITQFRSVSDLVDEIISTENRLVDGYENWVQIARSLHDYPIEWDRLNQWRNDEYYHKALNSANIKGSRATIRSFHFFCEGAGISTAQPIKKDSQISENLKWLFN
jgi:hypothetical protein